MGHPKGGPTKTRHSKEEVRWVAGVRKLLYGAVASVDDVIRDLIHGDRCSLSDARIGKVVLEYDEAYWHGDMDRDVRKMQILAARDDLTTIVRLRRGNCPRLPIDPNCRTRVVLIHIDTKNPIKQLEATAAAMGLPFDRHEMEAAVRTGNLAHTAIDTRTAAKIASLTAWYGNEAGPICTMGGVKSRLLDGAFVEKLDRVHAMCGGDGTRMCNFMCDGVAAALAGPDVEQFFQSVGRLRVLGIVDKGLDTFMCNGVASRLVGRGVDGFFVALGRLQAHPFGCNATNMVTLMCDGAAAGIAGPNPDAFFELLHWIKTNVCGGSVAKMCTFACNGVALAMADDAEAFYHSLERLEREFTIQNQRLVPFMCNGAMSTMMHENADVFWTALGRLHKEFGISGQRLATFMNGGVASFILKNADRCFEMLRRLKADFGVLDLVQFVNNSLSSASKGPKATLFWEGMERLNDALGTGGLVRIMCNGVASHTSSEKWVDAVLGVLSMTSANCVGALVYVSPVVGDAEAVHTRLQPLAPSERKRFEVEVCKGHYSVKGKRVREWLGGN